MLVIIGLLIGVHTSAAQGEDFSPALAYAALSQEQWFVSAEADRLERLRQLAE